MLRHRSVPPASADPAELSTGPQTTRSAGTSRAAERWALASLLAGAAGIAFAPIFVRLSELPPTATAFHRLFLALPALWLWKLIEDRRTGGMIAAGSPPVRPRDSATLLTAAGLFFAGDLTLWHWSIRFTSVANATLLANFAPIFVTLAGYLVFTERFSRQFLLGMALAIVGAGILPRRRSSGGKHRSSGISRQGDRRLRTLFALGASTLMRNARTRPERATSWQRGILARRPMKVAVIAQAAKTARIAWAILTSGGPYRAQAAAA